MYTAIQKPQKNISKTKQTKTLKTIPHYSNRTLQLQDGGTDYILHIKMAGSGNKRIHERDNAQGEEDTSIQKPSLIQRGLSFLPLRHTPAKGLLSVVKGKSERTLEIQGPQPVGGSLDAGDNAIKPASTTVVNLIKKYLDKNNKNTVTFDIEGHSRGGVSLSFIMRELESLGENELYNNRLKCSSAIQYDPVPGQTFSFADMNTSPYYKMEYPSGGSFLAPKTAVIYSLYTQYGAEQAGTTQNSFVPQAVYGSDIVILEKKNHSVGLNDGTEARVDKLSPGVYLHSGQSYTRIVSYTDYWRMRKVGNISKYRHKQAGIEPPKSTIWSLLSSSARSPSIKEAEFNYNYQEKRYQVIDNVVADWFKKHPPSVVTKTQPKPKKKRSPGRRRR